jgi:hypothetical protein
MQFLFKRGARAAEISAADSPTTPPPQQSAQSPTKNTGRCGWNASWPRDTRRGQTPSIDAEPLPIVRGAHADGEPGAIGPLAVGYRIPLELEMRPQPLPNLLHVFLDMAPVAGCIARG